jgi:peptide/nickel transport system substrate-binding protein
VLANTTSMQRTYVVPVKSIVATAADKVEMTLTSPNVSWPRQTTFIPIAPAKTYNAATFRSKPVSAGPYQVVDFNATENMVTVEANPNYYGPKPSIRKATIQNIGDQTTRLNALQSGQIDVALLDGTNVNVAKSAGLQVTSTPSSKLIYLGYNLAAPGLDSLKLRQAVSLAVDRSALVKTLLAGYGQMLNQLVPPATFGYDGSIKVPAADVAAAKKIVQESGHNGDPILSSIPPLVTCPTHWRWRRRSATTSRRSASTSS